jgi:glutamine synthetase
VPVKYGHSEVGYIPANEGEDLIWEQHEVELALAPLPRAADAIALTCWVLRNLAWRENMRCSFEPIMRKGHAGSGLHVHMSPVRGGQHLPVPQEHAELPQEARWLIGGLARMGGALMAFGNRTEGSFVRLTQGKEAPNRVTWGRFNRHALIRLPIQATTEDGRSVSVPTVEFRLADGSAHSHLLLAGLAQAMCLGKESPHLDELLERTRAGGPASKESSPVPRTFGEVAASLRTHYGHLTAGGIFPERFLQLTLSTLDDVASRGMSPL